MEPAEGDEMRRTPASSADRTVTHAILLTRMAFWCRLSPSRRSAGSASGSRRAALRPSASTETFTLLAICEWFNVLNCRSATRSCSASTSSEPVADRRPGGELNLLPRHGGVPPRVGRRLPHRADRLLQCWASAWWATSSLWVEELLARRPAARAGARSALRCPTASPQRPVPRGREGTP